MTTKDQDLDRELATLFAEDAAPGDHREADELFAYLAGELDEEARESLLAHLERCRECTARLVELEPLASPEAPREDGIADLADAAAWRSMKVRLAAEETDVARPARRGLGVWQAAAAVFFAATVLLSWRVAELGRSVETLAAPRANVPIVYADPVRDEGSSLVLPAGEELVVLALSVPAPEEHASYAVEIADAGGKVLWEARDLELSDYGTLRLALTRRYLKPGSYRLRLYGDAGREPILDYPLEAR